MEDIPQTTSRRYLICVSAAVYVVLVYLPTIYRSQPLALFVIVLTMHTITSTTVISWVVFFTLSVLPLAAGRNLVPAKRAVTLETRSLWKRDLVPRNNVQLNYGLCK